MDKDGIFPATVMPDPDWWQALWPDPLAVLVKLGLTPGMRAVDLCCGDGHFTAPMCQLLNGKVVAIDLDPDMLSLAKQAIEAADVPAPTWIEGDARNMRQLLSGEVDAVLIANTFHGVPSQTEMAQSVYEILKPGGRFIVVNWHVRPREETPVLGLARGPRQELRMSPDDVSNVVTPAGFILDGIAELEPYHYGAIFRRK